MLHPVRLWFRERLCHVAHAINKTLCRRTESSSCPLSKLYEFTAQIM
jgi:hypothetical protein